MTDQLPEHVAIIMDGNGRWARKHKLSVSKGHRQGTETLREIIRHTDDLGIGALSLYAFSTENWNRSAEEVGALMQLILDFFASEIDELDERNVRILILGEKSRLPQKQRETLTEAERRTVNTGLRLNIALNYGGRAELVRAARLLAEDVEERPAQRGRDYGGNAGGPAVYRRPAGCGSADPHQRGAAAEQFPAVSVRLRGV